MITINIQKKEMYLLSAIIVFLVGVGIIIAYNSGADPSVMGHDVDEIDWTKFINEIRADKIITPEIIMGQDNILTLGIPQGSIVLKTPGTQGPVFFGIQTINPKTTLDVNGQISASQYCGMNGTNCKNINELYGGGEIVNIGLALPTIPGTYYRVSSGSDYYYLPVYSFSGYNPLEYEIIYNTWRVWNYQWQDYQTYYEYKIKITNGNGNYKYCLNEDFEPCIPEITYDGPFVIEEGSDQGGFAYSFAVIKDVITGETIEISWNED